MILMHGHRHVDWIGECGGLVVVSAPSVVMETTDDLATYFYVHTITVFRDMQLGLLPPQQIIVEGKREPA